MNLIILAAVFVLRAVWLYFALSVNKPWVYAVLAAALIVLSLAQGGVMSLLYRRHIDLKSLLAASALSAVMPIIYVGVAILPLPTEIFNLFVCILLAIVSVAAVFAVCWLSFVVVTRGESPLNEPINRRKAVIMSAFASGIAFIHNLFWFIFIAKALAANNGHAFIAVLFIIIVNFLLEAALTLIFAYLHLLAANPKTETEKI